jgi:hypothetical protein
VNAAVAIDLGEAEQATDKKNEVGFGYGIERASAVVGCTVQGPDSLQVD